MSTSSKRSYMLHRNFNSVKSVDVEHRRSRASSRAQRLEVSHDDAFSFALRAAFLYYLLQPKQKRKKFIPTPAPPKRLSTSVVTDMMSELGKYHDTNKSFKLPSGFHKDLERRMNGVIIGQERLQGFNEPNIKRSVAQAYNYFTAEQFRKARKNDRRLEAYILGFLSEATKACQQILPEGDAHKTLAERHLVLFIRLITSVLERHGDRADLVASLKKFQDNILNNNEALTLASSSSREGKYVEEDVPLTYEVKDMGMVQDVAKVFGQTNSGVQTIINENKSIWTEEAALKDLKSYQHRLTAALPGTLSPRDFDLDEGFTEWKSQETQCLTQMMLDILNANPELAKTNTDDEKPIPLRPQSIYATEESYRDLGRRVQSPDSDEPYGFDTSVGMGSLSLNDSKRNSIRMVDDTAYVFIPPKPREYYKAIVKSTMTYDLVHMPAGDFNPVSSWSQELLTEIAMRWRIPQFTRHVVLLEVAAEKFEDNEMSDVRQLGMTFDFVKEDQPEQKKPPRLHQYNIGLKKMDSSKWTMGDFAAYRQSLHKVHRALKRELYKALTETYQEKKATHKVVCLVLQEHVYGDPAFSQRVDDQEAYTQSLKEGLQEAAMDRYSALLNKMVPEQQDQWDFTHIVILGKHVVDLCKMLKKRFAKTPEIEGANPYRIFVEAVFPSFENDARAMIERIFVVSNEKGVEIPVQEAFLLYRELNQIRDHHEEVLPKRPFQFSVEDLLVDFAWKYLKNAEDEVDGIVDRAILSDNFKVRCRDGEEPSDEERHSLSIIDIFRFFHQTATGLLDMDWRDPYQSAKLRTAVASILSRGISRYCEMVDTRFAQEMDRPSAQEVAVQQQSGLMKYAKDVLTTRERPEPFQFYAESFVKLNNIEYAMQELDKLSSALDVEQCIKIIEARDGPVQRATRTPTKYVFTIKIVEAEDLKACDPSGYSDPYVVLCDEFQERLYKSRIVNRNLNPQWNETVDITVTQPLMIVATIWDWDTFGDHDFVGRTSFKLDPRHFNDYLPREFWLNLDTQGRMLLRISMEGERNDIQYHFGKAFRYLRRTEKDMVRKITDKLVAEINAAISVETLRELLNPGIGASITSLWNKRAAAPLITNADKTAVIRPLLTYFDDNFEIMKLTLTGPTMIAVMARLWKEVLSAIESLLVPPLSDKPSTKKPLNQQEQDVVFLWKEELFKFFNARDETGVEFGVPETVLKSPKWHDLGGLCFFYNEPTDELTRESERMAAAAHQRQKAEISAKAGSRQAASASLMVPPPPAVQPQFAMGGGGQFASMGTIRRGKSIAMTRNLGTMRRAKEEKRKEIQAEPSDDMILRILRMRPEAAGYLKERARQKERMQAVSAAAMIVRNSVFQGFPGAQRLGGGGGSPRHGGGNFGRGIVPRR